MAEATTQLDARLSPRHRRRLTGLLFAVTAAVVAAPAQAAALTVTVVGNREQPVAGAAVSVTVKGGAARTTQATAQISQRNRTFVPGTLVVQSGTSVSFPNEDSVRHHVYSFSTINPFEIKLYVGTPAKPVTFDKPGTAVLGCNIHDQMVGFIHVVDTPYFGLSDDKGKLMIDVPTGEHQLRVWHPDLSADSPGVVFEARVTGTTAAQTVRLPLD